MLTDFMTYFDVTDVFSRSIKLHSPGRFRVSSESKSKYILTKTSCVPRVGSSEVIVVRYCSKLQF